MSEWPQFEQETERRVRVDDGLCGKLEPVPPGQGLAARRRVNVSGAGADREGAGRFQ
jgi:hypothetical protein